jgi:hypothetical protein
MEQATDTSIGFHFRMTSIMAVFLVVDISMFISAVNYTLSMGATMLIVFGFEVCQVDPVRFVDHFSYWHFCKVYFAHD